METPDACDPYGRPARRTQWIVSTLAYHYGLDRGVENEIIVLATGLDQYLQEIFHHLDCRGEGRVPAEDFRVLCAVLGLGEEAREEEVEESSGILDSLPGEFTFRQFHAKLCGYFSTRAGRGYEDGRLLVGGDSEHIETQIRLRSPLRRRGKLLSPAGSGAKPGCKPGSCTRECYEEIVALEEAEDRMAKLEEENASLRELVEDMRAALQSSDARALALQVGLWKSHAKHRPDSGCFIARHKRSAQKSTFHGNLKSLQGFLREVELAQVEQVEEVLLLKHQEQKKLEQELRASREAALGLEECNRTLKMEHMEMRKKVEEARQALLVGLGKVKELESKANQIPVLQRHIEQLEMELLYFRSEMSKQSVVFSSVEEVRYGRQNQRCCSDSHRDRDSPTGRAENAHENVEEQLFRSVEGQAASDEEEERWTGEQQRQVDEVKKILTRLSCCGDRCDDRALKRLLSHCGDSRAEESYTAVLELLDRVTRLHKQLELRENQAMRNRPDPEQIKDSLLQELQQKAEETELLHRELQMLETERVRLSLVEEKLLDVLQLLQQLRELNVSRRSLGKILLSTLESCSDPQHGKAHILEVLNALCHELAACEVLSSSGVLEKAQSHQSLTNPLLISC
ncbi:EF-hand and coiled-coil domain-containing protein 1 [Astyanax mexicanus]|uniref:EF-hand and coiled-coil domain-containing protein 1 n=1 Tax=Astyanax mexicanus TaxID=7994 RepID=A0A8T2KUT0_ASTMX|nr:EF-hand and coiled-coil domain-containing protein 1 [Astyanax mexicanus]KAG9260786.1 EF-hand and coiled-coil domain-containing protein 1 [Astyanax mexicanus]